MATELELIEAMAVLQVQPGDVVVLKTPISLTNEQAYRIRELVSSIVKTEVLILTDGLEIGVLRQAA